MNKQIVEMNPMRFCVALQEAVQDGFVINVDDDFCMFGTLFTIGMTKSTVPLELDALFIKPKKLVSISKKD